MTQWYPDGQFGPADGGVPASSTPVAAKAIVPMTAPILVLTVVRISPPHCVRLRRPSREVPCGDGASRSLHRPGGTTGESMGRSLSTPSNVLNLPLTGGRRD